MWNLFSSVFLAWSWTVGSVIWQFNSQEKREGEKSSQNTNEGWETQDFDNPDNAHHWSCRAGKGQPQQTSTNWFTALKTARKINHYIYKIVIKNKVLFCKRKCLKRWTLISKLSTDGWVCTCALFQQGAILISLEQSMEQKWLTTVIAYVNDYQRL